MTLIALPFISIGTFLLTRKPTYHWRTPSQWFDQVRVAKRSVAVEALRKLGTNTVPVLVRALQSANRNERYKAAWTLSQLDLAAASAVPELALAVGDVDYGVQYYAMLALSNVSDGMETGVASGILSKLSSTNLVLSGLAAEILEKMEHRRKSKGNQLEHAHQVQYLHALVRSPSPSARVKGVRMLSQFTPQSDEMTAVLQMLLADTNAWVRQEVQAHFPSYDGNAPRR